MNLGFGCYRVSNKSQTHFDALKYAIDNGLKLIDTSTNYTDGQSEGLIGEVIKTCDQVPLIVSKAGYIQGSLYNEVFQNEEALSYKNELTKVDDGLWHCMAPDFIEEQLRRSLSRLGVDKIECYLIHNPEYYFHRPHSHQDEYYQKIQHAFAKLEELVEKGLINSYGISSNNFILKPNDEKVTNIDKVYECALNLKKDHNFKYIQFPFNLIEIDALDKHYGGLSLMDKAKAMDLKIMINRPLNAFKDNRVIRLANYEGLYDFSSLDKAQEKFDQCFDLLEKKVKDEDDQESVFEIPLVKQFQGLWKTLPTPDAVEQVYYNHFFPLVARVWGEDLSPKDSQPFYDLFDLSLLFARKNMSDLAKDFESQAIKGGLLDLGEESLQIKAIQKYFDYGVDYVLVGMKHQSYVKQLQKFL